MQSQVMNSCEFVLLSNILPIIWVAAKYISFSCKNITLKMSKRRLVLFQESEKKRKDCGLYVLTGGVQACISYTSRGVAAEP